MSVLYPIAANAEAALAKPLGRAAREREARAAARLEPGVELRFTVEEVGPAFNTREEALSAYRGRLEDAEAALAPEDRYLTLREVLAPVKGRSPLVHPVQPVFKGGRRWPKPQGELRTSWRLSISYWRLVDPNAEAEAKLAPARKARKHPSGEALDREALAALTRQPLKPVEPQRSLDIGLFEVRAPENPGLVLPDE
jgi:hypothetical protein